MNVNSKNNHADGFPFLFIDRLSYMGKCICQSPLMIYRNNYVHNFHIGKYCSLANNIKFMINLDHDYLRVNTGFLDVDFVEYLNKYDFKIKRKGQILIQNDVWIGESVIILPSVTIHNGSVIGAGSVVTKDVPPYSIVAGNPARVIKYRFDKNIIDKLLSIRWWDWSIDKINENKDAFDLPIEDFVNKFFDEKYYESHLKKIKSKINNKLDNIIKYLYVPDFEYKFSTWKHVIKGFASNFLRGGGNVVKKELVIFILNSSCCEDNLNKIIEINNLIEHSPNIKLVFGDKNDLENNFLKSHYYITNRSVETINYSCLADYYHTKIISGVDIPIF